MPTKNTRNSTTAKIVTGLTCDTLDTAIMLYLADNKARNLSPCTISLNATVMAGFSQSVDKCPADITPGDVRQFLILKATATSPATAARYYDCLCAFFRFLHAHEHIPANIMQKVQKPKFSTPVIEPLNQQEIEALMEATSGNSFKEIRDRIVILVLIDSGLRASELTALTLDDVNWNEQYFQVRHGKGDKARRVPFGNTVASELRGYIARRGVLDSSEPLIVNVYGKATDRSRIRRIVEAAAIEAKLNREHVGAHLLRHTFAVSYLRAGGDVFSLQKCLGHAGLAMTRHYAELADSDVMNKHRQYSPGDRLNMPSAKAGRKQIK